MKELIEVIKCKDCIHWKACIMGHHCEVFDWISNENDFCSFAERKGENGDK